MVMVKSARLGCAGTLILGLAVLDPALTTAATPGESAASAPASGDDVLAEIVVTVQHRSENLQSVPVAVDSLSASQLVNANVTNFEEMSRLTPALQIGRAAGPVNLFFLRGIGSNATVSLTDPAIAVNYDGEFQARQYGGNGQFYDLERVEVLKGPQGTLYGRNATGGVINVIPAHPDFTQAASISYTGGNYALSQATAWANVPITDSIATRASFQSIRHSGYLSDGQADEDSQAGRLQFLFNLNDRLSVNLAGDYFHSGGLGGGNAITSNGYSADQRIGLTDSRVQAVYLNAGLRAPQRSDLHNDSHFEGVHATINWDTDVGTLTIIPAIRHAHLDYAAITGEEDIQTETDHQGSVEARFASGTNSRLSWVAGGYYLRDNIDTQYAIDNVHALTVASPTTLGGLSPSGFIQAYTAGTNAKAAFGDATFKVADGFRLIGGIRFTNENKTANGTLAPFARGLGPTSTVNGYTVVLATPIQLNGDTTWRSANWRAGFEWDIAEHSIAYATVATGFHSGGFFFTADNPTYQPEKLIAYTLGSKNRFAGNRFQANAELFYWKYTNQQLSHVTQDSIGDFVFATENAGGSKIRGGDLQLEFRAATDTLLSAQVQYLHTVFDSFTYLQPFPVSPSSRCGSTLQAGAFRVDCSGQPLVQAPKLTLDLGLQQTWELVNQGSIVLDVRGHHQTGAWTAISYLPVDYQHTYWMGDAALSYIAPEAKWSWAGFVSNFTNATVLNNTNHTNVSSSQLRAPRTYGLRFTVNF
jgi:iron complex outermembrane receptor protein